MKEVDDLNDLDMNELDTDDLDNDDMDSFDSEKISSAKIYSKRVKKGDTLDYYNDDLSLKAVGKLFDDKEDGTDDVYDEEVTVVTKLPKRAEVARESADRVASIRENAARTAATVRENTSKTSTRDGAGRTASPRPAQKQAAPVREPDDADDDSIDYNLYRKKEKQPSRSAKHSAPTYPTKPKTAKKLIPQKAFDDEPEEDFHDDYSDRVFPAVKVVIGVLFCLMLIMLFYLVYKVNTMNEQVATANAKVTATIETEKNYNALKIEVEGLKQTLKAATDENEFLKSRMQGLIPSVNDPAPPIPNTQNPPGGIQAPPANPGINTGETTYTVAKGDSLRKISKNYYGTELDFKKIMDANGLKDERIQIGQVLKIPK